MKGKILFVLIIGALSFSAGYELGNSQITNSKFSRSFGENACPYLNENSSAKKESDCPYLNKESESKCPYQKENVQKSGIKIRLTKNV